MGMLRALAYLFAALVVAGACERGRGEGDGRAVPEPASPTESVSVDVVSAGEIVGTIDAALLAGSPPAFAEGARRAFAIPSLLERVAGRPMVHGEAIEVEIEGGRRLAVGGRRADGGAVLVVGAGPAYVARLRADPARFEGRLADAERPGTRIDGPRAFHIAPRKRARAALAVEVDGRSAGTLAAGDFEALAERAVVDPQGVERPALSLRALAVRHAGEGARVVAVAGPRGRLEGDELAPADDSRSPVLRLTRRGSFKLVWVDRDLRPLDDLPGLSDVESVAIASSGVEP
jgi:hypothetical protein